jgi:hypothetical protein
MRETREGIEGRDGAVDLSYDPPAITVLGTIAELTLGSTTAVPDITTTGSTVV